MQASWVAIDLIAFRQSHRWLACATEHLLAKRSGAQSKGAPTRKMVRHHLTLYPPVVDPRPRRGSQLANERVSMFLRSPMPPPKFRFTPLCALHTASNPAIGSLIPRLTVHPQHGVFMVDDLATLDGVLLQLRACVRWQDAPERNAQVGRVDSRMLVLHFAKRQLAERLAQTYLGDLLLDRGTMDTVLLLTLQRCATDLPVRVDAVHLLSFGIAPLSEASHNTRGLAAMRVLLARPPILSVQDALAPTTPAAQR